MWNIPLWPHFNLWASERNVQPTRVPDIPDIGSESNFIHFWVGYSTLFLSLSPSHSHSLWHSLTCTFMHPTKMFARAHTHARVFKFVSVCERACVGVCLCVHTCVCVCGHVFTNAKIQIHVDAQTIGISHASKRSHRHAHTYTRIVFEAEKKTLYTPAVAVYGCTNVLRSVLSTVQWVTGNTTNHHFLIFSSCVPHPPKLKNTERLYCFIVTWLLWQIPRNVIN